MTVLINASPTNGLQMTSDGSGIVKLQSNGVTTNALAWVSFVGNATPTVNSSYNVSSITFISTGNWTVNFSSALSSASYVPITTQSNNAVSNQTGNTVTALATTGFNMAHFESGIASNVAGNMYAVVFGN